MTQGKSWFLNSRLALVVCALITVQSLYAGRPGEVRESEARRSNEAREAHTYAEMLRVPEIAKQLDFAHIQRLEVNDPKLKAFVAGDKNVKFSELKADSQRELALGYRKAFVSPEGRIALDAFNVSLTPTKLTDLAARISTPEMTVSAADLSSRFALEHANAGRMDRMPVEMATEFVKPGGLMDRMANNPELRKADAQDTAKIMVSEARALFEKAADLETKGEDGKRYAAALREATALAGVDPKTMADVAKLVLKPTNTEERELAKGNALAMEGLLVVLKGNDFAKGSGEAARTELSKQILGLDTEAAKTPAGIKAIEAQNELIKADEAVMFKKVKAEGLLKKAGKHVGELKKQKNMDDLLAKLDELIAKEGDRQTLSDLKEIRLELSSKRLMAALEKNENFKKMEPKKQLELAACALRASGLTSTVAKVAALSFLCGAIGFAKVQGALDPEKKTGATEANSAPLALGFVIPDELFGEQTGIPSATRNADKTVSVGKEAPAHKK